MPVVRRVGQWRKRIGVERDVREVFHAGPPPVIAEGVVSNGNAYRGTRHVVLKPQQGTRAERTTGGMHIAAVKRVVGDGNGSRPRVELSELYATPQQGVVLDGDSPLVTETGNYVVIDGRQRIVLDCAPAEVHLNSRPEVGLTRQDGTRTGYHVIFDEHSRETGGTLTISVDRTYVRVYGNGIASAIA